MLTGVSPRARNWAATPLLSAASISPLASAPLPSRDW